MNRLGLVVLVVLAAACGDARRIRTFEDPEVDAGPDDAGVVNVHVPHDAGMQQTLDAGPNATCSNDGWCLDALLPDGSRLTPHHLRSVFALDATHVYAAGDNGTMLRRYGP